MSRRVDQPSLSINYVYTLERKKSYTHITILCLNMYMFQIYMIKTCLKNNKNNKGIDFGMLGKAGSGMRAPAKKESKAKQLALEKKRKLEKISTQNQTSGLATSLVSRVDCRNKFITCVDECLPLRLGCKTKIDTLLSNVSLVHLARCDC